jgi:hypothetical protein
MKGGVLGRIASELTGKKLTVHQKAKELAYGSLMRAGPLKSFSEYGYYDFKVDDEFGNKPELVAFAGYMINGFYGIINIQTENDVIALRRLFTKFKKGGARLLGLPGMDKTPLQQEWIAAGSPMPFFGDIMKNAKGILENAGKKGLLRTTFNPQAGSPEDTDEAKNAVLTLNEADQARTTASISAAEFSNTIGSITYDASPYNTTPEKKKGFFGGSRKSKSRKSKSLKSGKSRKSRKSKSKSRKSRN